MIFIAYPCHPVRAKTFFTAILLLGKSIRRLRNYNNKMQSNQWAPADIYSGSKIWSRFNLWDHCISLSCVFFWSSLSHSMVTLETRTNTGDTEDPYKYWPLSIISAMTKIFRKIKNNAQRNSWDLDQNYLLSGTQFRFRCNFSRTFLWYSVVKAVYLEKLVWRQPAIELRISNHSIAK